MVRGISRQIVGYDPKTESVAVEYTIPSDKWREVTDLVKHDEEDPEYIYAYPLGLDVADNLIRMLGKCGDQNLNYFLECHSLS